MVHVFLCMYTSIRSVDVFNSDGTYTLCGNGKSVDIGDWNTYAGIQCSCERLLSLKGYLQTTCSYPGAMISCNLGW